MEKLATKKPGAFAFTKTDRIFMAVVALLIFVKITVDAFNLYSNDIRAGVDVAWWVPFVEQYTSYIFLMVGLPFIVWAARRFPLTNTSWSKNIIYHFGFTIMFFLMHVQGFIALRKLIFPLFGTQYSYGGWPQTTLLEFPIDLSSYVIVVISYIVITHLSKPKQDKEQAVELSCGSRTIWVNPSEIIYAQAAGNYVDVVLKEKTHLVRSTLEDLQSLINAQGRNLRRIHRSSLVNPDHIRERAPAKNGSRKLTMSNGDVVSMSRRYADALD